MVRNGDFVQMVFKSAGTYLIDAFVSVEGIIRMKMIIGQNHRHRPFLRLFEGHGETEHIAPRPDDKEFIVSDSFNIEDAFLTEERHVFLNAENAGFLHRGKRCAQFDLSADGMRISVAVHHDLVDGKEIRPDGCRNPERFSAG
jgi:hypothetical protein